jgi:hypothetical protein
MAGIYFEVIDGKRKGKKCHAENKQEQKVLSLGKLHVYFFDELGNPIVEDGRHVNGLISLDKLKMMGFYD